MYNTHFWLIVVNVNPKRELDKLALQVVHDGERDPQRARDHGAARVRAHEPRRARRRHAQ